MNTNNLALSFLGCIASTEGVHIPGQEVWFRNFPYEEQKGESEGKQGFYQCSILVSVEIKHL